jgi:hypothetical protein
MSYVSVKNPAFPKLGRLRLGNYAPVTNPAFPMMSDFGTGSCPGKCATCPKKRKCRSKRRAGLGDDSTDINFGIDPSFINLSQPNATYPASPSSGVSYVGSGYGTLPSEVSSDTYDTSPTGPASPVPSVASSGVIPVLNNPQTSYLTVSGSIPTTAASATSPLGGLSTTTVILGGLGVLAVVMLASAGKRR